MSHKVRPCTGAQPAHSAACTTVTPGRSPEIIRRPLLAKVFCSLRVAAVSRVRPHHCPISGACSAAADQPEQTTWQPPSRSPTTWIISSDAESLSVSDPESPIPSLRRRVYGSESPTPSLRVSDSKSPTPSLRRRVFGSDSETSAPGMDAAGRGGGCLSGSSG